MLLMVLGMTLALPLSAAQASAKPLRVLILSGLNNHDWKSTTPVLESIFKGCARFSVVDISEHPASLTAADFAKYDVLVSNWTPYPETKRSWPAETEQAFLDYIRNGGGFVVIHAASCSFQEWPEFQKLVALTWKADQTAHGAYHTYKVTIVDKQFPVTSDMPDFFTTDELYHRMAHMSDEPLNVAAQAFSAKEQQGTGTLEPVLVWTQMGKGRGINTPLGHDAMALRNPAVGTLLVRAAEWAATGNVTIPIPKDIWPYTIAGGVAASLDLKAALAGVAAYEYGQDRKALYQMEQTVFYSTSRIDPGGEAYRKSLARQIAATIAAPATTATGKKFLCKQLAYIGTRDEIPVLASLLTDDKVSHMARYALEQIPAQEVDLALMKALSQTTGALRIGVVNSLGNRKVAAASDELIALLNDPDRTMVEAAATSLAMIDSEKGARAVARRLASSKGGLRDNLANIYLRFAFGFQSTGNPRAAGAIYKQMYDAQEKPSVRATALRGLVELNPQRATALISDALQSNDKTIRLTAVLLARITPARGATKQLAACLPKLSPEMQICLIGALAERADASGIEDVFKAYAAKDDAAVRAVALTALGKVNDSSQLMFLLERAAATTGDERQAARDSLARMHGATIDGQLGAKFETVSSEVKIEIIRTLAARNAKKSFDTLMKAAGDKDSKVRIEAWRALGGLGNEKRFSEMVDLLEKAHNEERADAEEAVVTVLREVPANRYPAAMILKKLDAALGKEIKLSLLRTLASAGDDRTLATIRAAAKDADADTRDVAIRGLCAWPTPAVIDDLQAQARAGDPELYRVLALGGCIRLLPLLPNRTPPDRVTLLTEWSKLATRAAEKRAILGQIGDYPTLAAMQMALPFLKDQETANEAGLAIVKIAQTLKASQPAAVRTAMQQVIGAARNEQVVKSADVILREVAKGLNPAPAPAPAQPIVSGPPEFKWVKLDTTFALMNREAVVWQLNYALQEAKPYFHPVALVNGTMVTFPKPPDHPWHRGLWFSWKMINGVNYWEEDPATGIAEGCSEVTGVNTVTNPDFSATITMQLSYHLKDKPAVLTEKRVMFVSAPNPDGGYYINWDSQFTAGKEDVHLKGGTAGGGYAGLSVRISQNTKDWKIINSEGVEDISVAQTDTAKNTHGKRARWTDFSFVDKATGQTAGIALIDSPKNLRFPSEWHNIIAESIPFGCFSPAPLWSQPYDLPAGKTLELRYRVFVHAGRPDPKVVEKEFERLSNWKE